MLMMMERMSAISMKQGTATKSGDYELVHSNDQCTRIVHTEAPLNSIHPIGLTCIKPYNSPDYSLRHVSASSNHLRTHPYCQIVSHPSVHRRALGALI